MAKKQIKIEEFNPERRKLSDLVEYPENPRIVTPERRQYLIESVTSHGRTNPPIINTDNTVIAGNQRLDVFAELYPPETEIWVMIPPRKLDEKEAADLNLRDNISIGEWDAEIIIQKYELEYLRGIGMQDYELADMGYDVSIKIDDDSDITDAAETNTFVTNLMKVRNQYAENIQEKEGILLSDAYLKAENIMMEILKADEHYIG